MKKLVIEIRYNLSDKQEKQQIGRLVELLDMWDLSARHHKPRNFIDWEVKS